ncbi:MAG: tRNA1(Val) (adenine(37)-N6)-methyltransferase [Shewanella sp.]
MAFTFKQFHIEDLGCGMPVSTDAVILGAWAPLTEAKRILDIGAGSGLLSLMAAQRSQAQITCVELEAQAALACQHNIAHSPWPTRFELQQCPIQEFSQAPQWQQYFDHIICNPPYFEHGPQAVATQRALARHTAHLSFTELLGAIARCLTVNGRASLILPVQSLERFTPLVHTAGLRVLERVDIHSVEGKAANRVLYLLGKSAPLLITPTDGACAPMLPESNDCQPQLAQAKLTKAKLTQPKLSQPKLSQPKLGQLTVRDNAGQYTPAMVQLTQDFYLKL